MDFLRAVAPLLLWAAIGWAALTITLWLALLGLMALQRLGLLHPDADPSRAAEQAKRAA